MPEYVDFSIRASKGSVEYTHLDWNGDVIMGMAAEASRRGINEITKAAADLARTDHPNWTSRTFQTEAAIFSREAIFEAVGSGPSSTPHVWGEWGVEDRPRNDTNEFVEEDVHEALEVGHEDKPLTTKDVAMFLEFGTRKMDPKTPFLYAAWDSTKLMLPGVIAFHYRELAAMRWRPGMGEGAFRSWASLWDR